MSGPPAVSVVIPTYNRSAKLELCLERLAEQDYPRDRFEVVVASDGSTDDTVNVARAAGRRLGLDVKVIETEHGGPGHARNVGARVAMASVLAFTDDDVAVGPNWLSQGLLPFSDATVGAVEGATEAELGDEALFHVNISNLRGGRYPTCNIFYRASAFAAVGGFDERFRRAREDSDLAFRILDAGYRIAFAPGATARHRTHRSSPRHPWFVASTLPDSVLLWAKHPGRDELRARFYRSDALKLGLAAATPVAVAFDRAGIAVATLGAFLVLTVRTMNREVVWRRALRPVRLLTLVAVYAVVPFAHLYYLAVGSIRVWRGLGTSVPAP